MNDIISFISQPWPWYVAGPLIALIMVALLLFGKSFGISSNFRTLCSVFGAGRHCEYFNITWRDQVWNLVLVAGLIIGGFISHYYLTDSTEVHISQETVNELQQYGINNPGNALVPLDIFNWESLATVKGFTMLVIGGFLIGFGTRYAGGCTSGHAISGLSDLQLASLIAVIGFFIGGLFITYLVLPHLLTN